MLDNEKYVELIHDALSPLGFMLLWGWTFSQRSKINRVAFYQPLITLSVIAERF